MLIAADQQLVIYRDRSSDDDFLHLTLTQEFVSGVTDPTRVNGSGFAGKVE